MYCYLTIGVLSCNRLLICTDTEYQTLKIMPILPGNATLAGRIQEKRRNG